MKVEKWRCDNCGKEAERSEYFGWITMSLNNGYAEDGTPLSDFDACSWTCIREAATKFESQDVHRARARNSNYREHREGELGI